MPQYRQPPRLVTPGFTTRQRRFHNAFRVAGDGRVDISAVEAHGESVAVNSDLTITSPMQNILVSANTGNVDVTLPISSKYAGIDCTVKRTDDNYNYQVNVVRQSSDVIDNQLTKVELHKPMESITLLSDGGGVWMTQDRYCVMPGHPLSIIETDTNTYQMQWYHLLFVSTKTTPGNHVVYLPHIYSCPGHTLYVKKAHYTPADVQIQDYPGGPGSIDEGTQTITGGWGYRGFYNDGSQWRVISRRG